MIDAIGAHPAVVHPRQHNMDRMDRPPKRARSAAQSDEASNQERSEIPTFSNGVPSLADSEEFQRLWETYQVVYLPRSAASSSGNDASSFSWKNIHGLFKDISEADKESFCAETEVTKSQIAKQASTGAAAVSAESLFRERLPDNVEKPFYCSFLVQKDVSAVEGLISKLPIPILHSNWHHEPCVWIFFGRNDDKPNASLQGRPEHTDSVSHDGTWHYQLSGVKQWMLRPTAMLLALWKEKHPDLADKWEKSGQDYRMTVECKDGDVIVINTRLWFHQTVLPWQMVPSVSYARDFWTGPHPNDANNDSGNMTNVDGLYATEDIEMHTIIFREADMPDCELHRSRENPNCQVVVLEDGSGAVVSLRSIAAGEFFCIAESDDDDDDDDSYGSAEEESSTDEPRCRRCPP
jgi:hypothetical protein